MRSHCLLPSPFSSINNKEDLTVALLKARSARRHFNDIIVHPVLNIVYILCLTEANIYEDQLQYYKRDGWTLTALHVPMSTDNRCHGLLVYTPYTWPLRASSTSHLPHMETVFVTTSTGKSRNSFCLVYRSPTWEPLHFIDHIPNISKEHSPDVLLGDFNFNVDTSNYCRLSETLTDYFQCLLPPTDINGSILDLVFIKKALQPPPTVSILPTVGVSVSYGYMSS